MPAAVLPLLMPALLTALAYALTGWLAVRLAIPPGYAAPIYPAAGIALAAALVHGRRALPGVALGAFAVNLLLAVPRGQPQWSTLVVPTVTGVGAAAQAALGAWLMRRRPGRRWTLDQPRDIVAFAWRAAALACLTNASLSTVALALTGIVDESARVFNWWTWWAGDTLGVLIGAPIALTLIGRPRADWAPRRITVGLPLLGATLLLALATVLVLRWDEQRRQGLFERDAQAAAAAVDSRLRESLYALEALRVRFADAEAVNAEQLRRAAKPWLQLPIDLQALGYAQRLHRNRIADLEREAGAVDGRAFRVFDRLELQGRSIAADDADVLAIRFIEPLQRNAGALGVNVQSIPASRVAIARSVASGRAAASAGFRLTQEAGDQTGVVVYQALYGGDPPDGGRGEALRGLVFMTLRMDQSMAAVMKPQPAYLQWCLVDLDAQAERRRLAGAAGCEAAASPALRFEQSLQFGERTWQLRLSARPSDVPEAGHDNAWLFSMVGMVSVALLATLLLSMSGHTRQVEAAVSARTADLEHEVAERQRTEAALRESEQRLRNILDQAPVGIVYADLDGRVRESNPKLREMVGYGADELAQRTLADLTHPDDRAGDAEQFARLLRGEIVLVQRRKRLRQRDGRVIWVQKNLSLLRDAAGQPQRLVAVVEDITEHLRLHEAERARERAESANRAKSEFLSRMSHELRTPLNAMLGFAQLLGLDRQPPLTAHQAEWTAQIQHAGWHLLEMINDTLDLSRIESGSMRLESATVELGPLLKLCVAMVEPAAGRRGIRMVQQFAPAARAVRADPTRLKQVLTNLLSNAIKYNVDDGRVELSSRRIDDATLEIEVLDTGLGLSEAQLAELFQPFNRLGREHSGVEGTGIGLVIARRLAELMGGSLQARSRPGVGSSFVLRLPAASDPDAEAAGVADEQPSAAPYRRRRVHYIEDNETNAEVMRGILAQRPQVLMELSTTGLDGLAAVQAQPPDLILLDMHLPDIDGLELLRHLKQDPASANIPVVVVSADATTARITEAIAAGASHYLTKPLNLASFLSLIDQLLEHVDTHFGGLE